MKYLFLNNITVQESGRSRMERDGVELLAFMELALPPSVFLGTVPGLVYLFYSEHSVLVNTFVSIFQALSPIPVSTGFGLLLVLGSIQVAEYVAFSFLTPQGMIIMAYFTSISSWISGFRNQW